MTLLGGCAVGSKTNNSELHFYQTAGIVEKVKPIAVLAEGIGPRQKISIKLGASPTISMGDMDGLFEIVAIHGKAGRKFKIEIQTTITIAINFGHGIAPGVNAIVVSRDGTPIGKRTRNNPGKYSIEGIFPSNDDFYVIAVADKKFKEQVVKTEPYAYGSLEGDIYVNAYVE